MEEMWALINMIQMSSYLTLLQIRFPKNLLIFFEYLESVHNFNKWMPNGFAYILKTSELNKEPYSDNFLDRGLDNRLLIILCGADIQMMILNILAICFLSVGASKIKY